ncbi:MAG: tetratricopeptide repeat protein, partial [Bacteroidetes bacterium]|nr:tetratricopeptide repeat protein [Bacteroidota bacterium]
MGSNPATPTSTSVGTAMYWPELYSIVATAGLQANAQNIPPPRHLGDENWRWTLLQRTHSIIKALALQVFLVGDERMEVAYTLNHLGWVYIDRDNLATADSLFRRSLAIRQKSVGNKHPSVGLAMHNLATLVYFPKNDLDGAEVMITGALEIFRTSLPGNHPNTATILNSMGRLRIKQGDPRAAEPFFREA